MTHGTYDPTLVALSVAIAAFASYTALDLANRVSVVRGRARVAWLAGGSLAMGVGIWSMHFIGMLAFSMPGTPVAYDVPLLILSVIVAILASAIALYVVSRRNLPWLKLVAAGLAMGAAISGMHYIGIASMRMAMRVEWDRRLVAASILIAVGAAFAALWLAFRSREEGGRGFRHRVISGIVMGIAISGMHYTAMAAMRFAPKHDAAAIRHEDVLATEGLAVAVTLTTVLILAIALTSSVVQRELERRLAMVEDNARLFREAKRRAGEEEALRRATEAVASAFTIDDVLKQIAAAALDATRADAALVEKIDLNRQEVEIAAASGEVMMRLGSRVAVAESFAQRVMHERRPLVLQDVRGLPRPFANSESKKDGPFSLVVVPLNLDERPVGALTLVRRRSAPPFQAHEMARAFTFAHLSTMAFRRVHLLEEAERRREQLEQTERLAGLGRVASTIAHEFNNILMAIQAFHEVARRVGTFDEYMKAAPQIDRAIQRGKTVTDAVLRLTRAAHPVPKAVNLCSWLETLRTDLRSLLPLNIHLDVVCHDASSYVWADLNHLEQAFVNLALNARDAMPAGGSFTIAARPVTAGAVLPPGSSPDEFIVVEVRDSGTGISSEVLPRIFQPMFTTKKEGTGLGLAITHEIIRAHGGSISVESAPARGTAFFIHLRRAPADAVESASAAAVAPKQVRRILLVEDDDVVADGLTLMMELEQLEVKRVARGGETLPAIKQFRPDVVILDVGLPDVDGTVVFQEIMRQSPEMPVVFATGHADETILARFTNLPNVAFLRKPFDSDALTAAIAAVTSPKHQAPVTHAV